MHVLKLFQKLYHKSFCCLSNCLPYIESTTPGTLRGSDVGVSAGRFLTGSTAALTEGPLVSPSSSSRSCIDTGSVEVRLS